MDEKTAQFLKMLDGFSATDVSLILAFISGLRVKIDSKDSSKKERTD